MKKLLCIGAICLGLPWIVLIVLCIHAGIVDGWMSDASLGWEAYSFFALPFFIMGTSWGIAYWPDKQAR